ncbi:MAG: response regulator [Gammaproteobacteria bacterium]|nr:response regulator [Gammaproteobacteria bacterium]
MKDENSSGTGRILVVDDDPKVLMILEEALKLFGYQPIACSSAMKALSLFNDAPDSFCSVITDQAMPGMSGDQLIKEIRLINESVPIVLCTGYADLSVEEWESELDLIACLKKPFTMSALSEVLAKITAHAS